jgi:hypothetical protein
MKEVGIVNRELSRVISEQGHGDQFHDSGIDQKVFEGMFCKKEISMVSFSGAPMKKKQLLALVQHPMWLLIKEDSKCHERTPPWGAPSVEEYSKRVERNLTSLEQKPDAKVSYDFSGTELEDIRATFPKIADRIKAAIARGQIQMVNGTYSQAHLHTLSLEAAIREFQYGLKVIKEYGQDYTSSYIIQEPGFTQQTPQILKAFGFKYCSKSAFPVYQKTLDSKTILIPDDFFCRWRGLDGTEVLTISGLDWYHLAMRRKLPDGRHLSVLIPDMCEMDVANNHYVLPDEVLPAAEKALKKTKLKAIKQYVPWSYLEGTDGEHLITLDTECETALVQMETVNALLEITPGEESEKMWKTWLACHHHDAYWMGAPELKEKFCNWLIQTIAEAREAAKKALCLTAGSHKELVCFNVYPKKHRGVVAVDWDGNPPERFEDKNGAKYPVQKVAANGKSILLVEYAAEGAGYATLVPAGKAKEPAKEVITQNFNYENKFYSVVFRTDGSLGGISSGGTLFPKKPCSALGAVTALVDGTIKHLNENILETSVQRGPVADILQVKASIAGAAVLRTTYLYHNLPWFENELQFDFNNTVLGESHFDVNKLNLIFPLDKSYEVVHGIGGGYSVPDEPQTAFFPVNWMDVRSGGVGLSIINFGTRKHWIKEDTLGITLAWGGNTKYFSNKVIDISIEAAQFGGSGLDLRLNGRRTFRYAIYPHTKGWKEANVPDIAMSLLRPPVILRGIANLKERESANMLGITGNVVPTSVFMDDNKLACRIFESEGRKPVYKVKVNGKEAKTGLTDAAGNRTGTLKPNGIGNIIVGK